MTSGFTSRRHGLTKGQKLRNAADFERARGGRERHGDAFFVIQCVDNGVGGARLGLAVGRRAARSAVGRNRLRRLIRESFRMHREELPAVDVIVIARAAATAAPNPEIFASLARLWREIGTGR